MPETKDLSQQEQEALDLAYRNTENRPTSFQEQSFCEGFETGWLAASHWVKGRVMFEGERGNGTNP